MSEGSVSGWNIGNKNVFGAPFVALFGLFVVCLIGQAVLH